MSQAKTPKDTKMELVKLVKDVPKIYININWIASYLLIYGRPLMLLGGVCGTYAPI